MRPIDLQVTIPKMTEIASLQGSESARRLLSSQQSEDSTRAMVAADTQEVHSKKNIQTVNMRADRDREAAERESRKRRRTIRRRGANAGAGPDGDKSAGQFADDTTPSFDIRL